MTEQEASDKLEELCGSVDKAFRLMRLYSDARSTVAGDRFSLKSPRTPATVFIRKAKADGYSDAAIQHYLYHIVGQSGPTEGMYP